MFWNKVLVSEMFCRIEHINNLGAALLSCYTTGFDTGL
jgi:hypothetical protein